METTRKIGKSFVTGVVLVVLLATAGLVFAAGNQAQEEGGIFQSWDTLGDAVMNGNTEGQSEHLWLYKKDPDTWEADMSEDAAWGRLVYFSNEKPNSESAPKCEFVFNAAGLDPDTPYRLINYARDGSEWPPTINCLGQGGTTDTFGTLYMRGAFAYDDLEYDTTPVTGSEDGYKIWLVPATSADCDAHALKGWDPTEYLFENNLINPEDNGQIDLLENAVEISPGVFYLGESQDIDGKPAKGYAFVHYAKGYESEVLETASEETCYSILWEDTRWAPDNVEDYVIYPENRLGLDYNSILTTFVTSVSTWEKAGELGEQYNIIGTGSLVEEKITRRRLDGTNMVRFGNLPDPAIAMTIIWTDGSHLIEWDQIYDDKDFEWSLSGEAEKMDFQNIATHELGHAVGLGDLYPETNPLCSDQTMWGYSTEGETKKQTLGLGDIAGINELYGEYI